MGNETPATEIIGDDYIFSLQGDTGIYRYGLSNLREAPQIKSI